MIFRLTWARPEGFRLLSGGVATVVEGVYVLLDVVGDRGGARVFELLVHLGARARAAVLLGVLRGRNFSLSEGPSCFDATAFHRVAVGFSFASSRGFEEDRSKQNI